ncbi:MAG UNVERIFIED_CONTAM: hypothetical protein LVR29_18165 [Microcystis novacekii LVE1205-3]|jgi:(E)-4-hydroxy-3-methylbut-2-enyl-diphosphate synthase
MADADYGYVGNTAVISPFIAVARKLNAVPESEGVTELINLIKADGRWVEP